MSAPSGPNRSRTKSVLELSHLSPAAHAHPNLFTFLGHIQRATVDYMTEVTANKGLCILHTPAKEEVKLVE